MGERTRPLRVALFAEQGHPDVAFLSGVGRLTDQFVRGCRRHRVELDYFTYHPEAGTDVDGCVRWHRTVPRWSVELHGLEVDGLDIAPFPNPRISRPARSGAWDVILATSPGIGTQAQILARQRGIPFAAVYTTSLPDYAAALVCDPHSNRLPGAGLLGSLAREAAWRYLAWLYDRTRTDLVLVPTEAARRDFLSRVDARAEVLGRGADTLSFPDVRRTPGPTTKLLYVGRIDYGEKNLAVLEQVVERVPGVEVQIVGDGDDLALMKRRCAKHVRAGRMTFTGHVGDEARLRAIYLSSDVFVFPSIHDTLGQVVLEAQKAGLPVVVRDRGGPPELVRDGVTGFVAIDDDAFVTRVAELAADPERRRTMGRSARRHADALPGWTDVIDDLIGRLDRIARPASARPPTQSAPAV